MSKKYHVAVVGASGVVGKEMINTLEQRKFPIETLTLLASERSAGEVVSFNGKATTIKVLDENSFEGVDFALFSAGGSVSEKFAPFAKKAGAVAIDNTSHFRMHDGIPLVVPEVNGDAALKHDGIIANPNCSTAQLVMALKPIYDAVGIERLVISTYQSVSGAGKDAILELENHSRYLMKGEDQDPKEFSKKMPFNVIPQIDVFEDNGYTKEEMKMINETKKILNDDNIKVTATAVRVPVFIGHSEAVNIQTKQPISVEQAKKLFNDFPGVTVLDDPANNEFPTPRDCSGKDDVYIGRIRKDVSIKNGLEIWVVADNLRKGAALNTVQIAEYLAQNA